MNCHSESSRGMPSGLARKHHFQYLLLSPGTELYHELCACFVCVILKFFKESPYSTSLLHSEGGEGENDIPLLPNRFVVVWCVGADGPVVLNNVDGVEMYTVQNSLCPIAARILPTVRTDSDREAKV